MTFEELKKLVEEEDLQYFIAPDRPMLMMRFGLLNGTYEIAVPLELDGRFVQFRTVGYQSCPSDHPHLEAVLRVLGELDYKLRITKFGWDPSDGEIVAYADMWLEDGTLTQKQFSAILHCFLPGVDLNYPRITKTIETGTDPGEFRPEDVLAAASGLPPELREILDRLAAGEPSEEPEPVGGPVEV